MTLGPHVVVVLSGAVDDSLRMRSADVWAEQLKQLLMRAQASSRLVAWLGAPPVRSMRPYDPRYGKILQLRADLLNSRAERVCGEVGSFFVPLTDSSGSEAGHRRAPNDYLFLARQIADALIPSLPDTTTRPEQSASSAQARLAAIERLKLNQHAKDPRLDALVAAAKRATGADMAMLTVLDDRYEWPLVTTAAVIERIPIEKSACIHTIQTVDGLIIADATKDARFAGSAFVTGPASLRYYAGYPLEAPDGTRIGALCVLSRTPRDGSTDTEDLGALRELALLTQRELWHYTSD